MAPSEKNKNLREREKKKKYFFENFFEINFFEIYYLLLNIYKCIVKLLYNITIYDIKKLFFCFNNIKKINFKTKI